MEVRRSRPASRQGAAEFELKDGAVVIAAITSCTNTSNPAVMIGGRAGGPQCAQPGLVGPAVGQDLPRPRLQGRDRVPDSLRTDGRPRGPRVQRRGLRLHHLHRQLRAPQSTDLEGDQRQQALGRFSPLGQPELRGPRAPGSAHELPGLAAARRRVRASPARWTSTSPATRSDATRPAMPSSCATSGPRPSRSSRSSRAACPRRCSRRSYANVFEGDERWRGIAVPESETYAWDGDSTYIQNPPYFEGMSRKPPGLPSVRGARCLALFGDSITTDHISPAGAIKKDAPAGRYLQETGRGPGRLQQLRIAPRQPRDHDARHLREHAHQEPDGAGRRGRRDGTTSRAASAWRSTTPP